jgi:hypothetical protein
MVKARLLLKTNSLQAEAFIISDGQQMPSADDSPSALLLWRDKLPDRSGLSYVKSPVTVDLRKVGR